MKMKILAASAIAISSVVAGMSASAATLTPDTLVIESNQNRADGNGTFDDIEGSYDFGDITGLTAGIAGRIVGGLDTFTFVSDNVFSMSFVDLADMLGVDIDSCAGFDGRDCSIGSRNNEPGRTAQFSLDNGLGSILSVDFTSNIAAGTSIFSNVAAGSYLFSIDGTSGFAGAAYDIAISAVPAGPSMSAVPVPAGLPLLLSALGVAGLVSRRKKA